MPELPHLHNLLADLSREQLQSLLLKLAEEHPALVDIVEKRATALRAASSPTVAPPPPVPVNAKVVRRQVQSIIRSVNRMRSSEAYWQVGAIVGEVEQLLEQAWDRIKADDGANALVLLEAITEEYMAEWESLDDSDGEASGFFDDLGKAWTEALLSLDLTKKERKSWADRLTSWQEKVEEYGVDEAFDVAATAVLDGWDYPPLQRVLQGSVTEQGAWEGEPPYYADDITDARLHILERRGRLQEYLYLAEAESHTEQFITMLVRMGRTEEAFSYGLKFLATTGEALALAKALYEHGEHEQALQISEHGLSLEGYHKALLAKWLRDSAMLMGKKEQALAAAERAFNEEKSLENYLHTAEIAGEKWPERQTVLLEGARHTTSTQGAVDIFLHEGLLDDAIAALGTYASHTLVEQVVDTALQAQSHFDWVIQACQQQAEYIMDRGKSEYYGSAANWLKKARTAYLALGHEKEWRTYLGEILKQHGRKYTLVPLLKPLQ
jgi:uncharacterized Zn finger protein